MKIRAKYTKLGYLKYLSHLDLIRLFNRSLTRTNLPVKFSEGYNPHPKLSLGNPLPLGIESMCEYFDIELTENISPNDFMITLNKVLPKDIKIIEAFEIDEFTPSISTSICISVYDLVVDTVNLDEEVDYNLEITKFLNLENIEIEKKKKKGRNKITAKVNIRPFLHKLSVEKIEKNIVKFNATVMTGEKGNIKPIELLKAIDFYTMIKLDLDSFEAIKIDSF
ncbi:MAG: DUF2344 domain-containing protein [Tissierellales bacterium]|nr:DUF2344 domain-containing protein [Tissierellales bacterium]